MGLVSTIIEEFEQSIFKFFSQGGDIQLIDHTQQLSFHRIFCGLAISVELYFFWENPGHSYTEKIIMLVLFMIFEFMNLMCHITLRSLRTKGDYLK